MSCSLVSPTCDTCKITSRTLVHEGCTFLVPSSGTSFPSLAFQCSILFYTVAPYFVLLNKDLREEAYD